MCIRDRQGIGAAVQNEALLRVNLKLAAAEAGGLSLAIVQPRSYGVEIRVIDVYKRQGQYRIILSADTASEVRQMPSQKRR